MVCYHIPCLRQDTPHNDTFDLLSSSDDEENRNDFKQQDECHDNEHLNLTVSSTDSEAAEADDEREGDGSGEFSVHEDDLFKVPSSDKSESEVDWEHSNDEHPDDNEVLVVEQQLIVNFAPEDAIEEAGTQNFEVPVVLSDEVQPPEDDAESNEIARDALPDQEDVEIVLKDIYHDAVVVNDPLLPQFEDSARSESEEEVIMIVQEPVLSEQRLSPQLDVEEAIPDESSDIRLRLSGSGSDEDVLPGSSKENDDAEVPGGSYNIDKVTEQSQGVEKPSDVTAQGDDATPSLVDEALSVISEQIVVATSTEKIIHSLASTDSVEQDDDNHEHPQSITDEKSPSDHEVVDDLVTACDNQDGDVPGKNVEESENDNTEVCHDLVALSDETESENVAAEAETDVQDPGVETRPEQDIDSRLQAPTVIQVVEESVTLHGAQLSSTNQSLRHHETELSTLDGQESDRDEEQVENSETASNKQSLSDDVVQEIDHNKQEECIESGIYGFPYILSKN